MIFSIVLPFVFGFLCIALKKLSDRRIKSAFIIAMQTAVTASGIWTVLADTAFLLNEPNWSWAFTEDSNKY